MAKAEETTAEQMDIVDRRLLDILQQDLPPTARPFAAIGEKLGLPEEEVLARVRRLKNPGKNRLIRQISAIFDTAALGYKSTLVAMQAPQDEVDRAAAAINRHPGVSHNYQRDHTWNLWFTLAVPPHEDLEATVEALVDQAGSHPYRPFPALRVFKIGMQLDMESAGDILPAGPAQGTRPSPAPIPNARDRAFIRELQEDIEIVPQPFAGVADRLRVSQDEVLAWLQEAKAAGWLRRFAAILHHREAGYVANGMVAWRVPDGSIERIATFAASLPQVSHCYQRLTYPDWPYNLFTMIHARSRENCRAIAREISQETGVSDYIILFSTKEYKKTRPTYFAPAEEITTSRSQSLHSEAQRYMPGGVNSPVRAFRAVGGEPLFITRGEGPYIYDADDRRYIDYMLSWGALILSHAHPQVVGALKEAAERGISYGAPTALETELAKRVVEAVPSIEMVRFVSSGTEATMSALRLARAFTGRSKIVKFEGCYHGHADFLLARAGSGLTTLGLPDSAGVPEAAAQDTLVAPYNDLQAVDRLFSENRGEIAAVIVEPVAGNMGVIPPEPGFLEGMREMTKAEGALLVFDEVITGFRLAYGGAQALYGVTPDLTCLGKVIGGGLPVGAYGGRREIMEMVAPLGPVYQAGTLSGNPLAMTAGIETLKLLAQPGVYERLEEKSARLANGLRAAAEAAGTPVFQTRVGSMFCTFFSAERVIDHASAKRSDSNKYARFFRAMLENGVYLAPSQFEAGFLSLAHSEQDIERTIRAAEAAFAGLGG
ncbi:MAG: glutamate-1-semialdehyde 2,1-aminomutase [Dehalococcoidia bacterium]|nr:MAG: glutamate-1-semialdehyde 2,1-aminomutase [Dehalococcoidia bacterium]